ncbi:hypothetical protein BS47DRAFT_1360270 [Hydnum rufescens UP504]|uniref:Uncharacterized protein n=1 Tax=Hydnum rufescens UP504 TaxID=1448309 RepID=A0A9P6B2R7_9AGAM|nr:hypothetical protein BS47DRAFT_1360270 [Hydnum rufescens UP504]
MPSIVSGAVGMVIKPPSVELPAPSPSPFSPPLPLPTSLTIENKISASTPTQSSKHQLLNTPPSVLKSSLLINEDDSSEAEEDDVFQISAQADDDWVDVIQGSDREDTNDDIGVLSPKHSKNCWSCWDTHQEERAKCMEFIPAPAKACQEEPFWFRKGRQDCHQILKPAYEELQKECGSPSPAGWHDHCETLVKDLQMEKASMTTTIVMTGGDVAWKMAQSKANLDSEGKMLCPIGVHLLYMMVSDLALSMAAHSQNLINFNSEELYKRDGDKGSIYIVEGCLYQSAEDAWITSVELQEHAMVFNSAKDGGRENPLKKLCFERIGNLDLGDNDILVTGVDNGPLLTVQQAQDLQVGKREGQWIKMMIWTRHWDCQQQ